MAVPWLQILAGNLQLPERALHSPVRSTARRRLPGTAVHTPPACLDAPCGRDQQVVCLQVAMDDANAVQVEHGPAAVDRLLLGWTGEWG